MGEQAKIEDKISYPNDLRDAALKLRVQLDMGWSGNNELEVLWEMIVDPIRKEKEAEWEELQNKKKEIYKEEYNNILIKYGTKKWHWHSGEKKTTYEILCMPQKIEKLVPEMFETNLRVSKQWQISKQEADNYINKKLLNLIMNLLNKHHLLLNYEEEGMGSTIA